MLAGFFPLGIFSLYSPLSLVRQYATVDLLSVDATTEAPTKSSPFLPFTFPVKVCAESERLVSRSMKNMAYLIAYQMVIAYHLFVFIH